MPIGKFKDKGKNWCQLYQKDGFVMKNLKTGEVREGRIFVEGDKLCLKGPKMTKPECSRAFYLKNKKKIHVKSRNNGYNRKVSGQKNYNDCSF